MLGRAKSLRTHQTDAELRLWFHLRAHRFMGKKFKRQKLVGHYIVDFICVDPKLIVEIDGELHAQQVVYDHRRDACLYSEGFTTLSPSPSPASGRGEVA